MWLLHEVKWCMVVWCAQNLRRDGSSFMWHQPCQRCKHTTLVDIKKTKTKRYKKLFTYVESHASAASLLKSGEQRYIKAIIIIMISYMKDNDIRDVQWESEMDTRQDDSPN